MSPLKHSKNFAARMGHWSASHWKTAVAGWLAFVALSVFVGMQVGTTQIDRNDANVGESRTADQIISDAGFAVDENGESIDEQGEMVLLQSKTLTVNDAAFRVAIADTVRALQAFPKVTKLRSPLAADHADLVSKDSHSALIQFTPTGTYDEVVLYIDTILSAVDRVQAAHTGFYIHSAGVSTDKALDKEIQGGLGKAGLISIPLTILILMIVLGSLVGAMIPLLVALSAIAATTGLLALSSQAIPASDSIMEVILLIGLAVGVDYSLFYMRREREERRAGRSATAALEAAAATSGRAVLISGITVLIAMAGMFLTGDKTFMSFSVGAMLVVAVAMIGSLTVLPAVLGKLGDGVERGRIPFVHRLGRQQGESRVWNAVLDRVLRRPVVSAVASATLLLVLAVPTFSIHTTQTGIDGISSSAVEPFKRVIDAFPGHPTRRGRDQGRRCQRRTVRAAIETFNGGSRDRRDERADQRRRQPRHNRRPDRDPAGRERHRRRRDRCARDPAQGRPARDGRPLAGVEYAVTVRPQTRRTSTRRRRARSRKSSASCCSSPSDSCSSPSARS